MKTKLLRKIRKQVSERVYAVPCYNKDNQRCWALVSAYNPKRVQAIFESLEHALKQIESLKREFTLREVYHIKWTKTNKRK